MQSRRSFLAASAMGAFCGVAGCTAVLQGGDGGDSDQPSNDSTEEGDSDPDEHSSAVETAEAFLTDPSFAPSLEVVGEPAGTVCEVTTYDTSLTEQVEELSVSGDLTYYGWGPLSLGEDSGAAIESVDFTTEVYYETYWEHDDPEGELPNMGEVTGNVVSTQCEYDRAAFEDAKGFTGSPDLSTNGYEFYEVDPHGRATGVAESGIVEGLGDVQLPGDDVDEATELAVAEALLERVANRSTGSASPTAEVRDVVDAVTPAHYLDASVGVTPEDGEVFANAKGFHVDGSETTVVLADRTSSSSVFNAGEWSDGAIEADFLRDVAEMTGRSPVELEATRDALLEGPTEDVGESRGVIRAVVPSDEIEEVRF